MRSVASSTQAFKFFHPVNDPGYWFPALPPFPPVIISPLLGRRSPVSTMCDMTGSAHAINYRLRQENGKNTNKKRLKNYLQQRCSAITHWVSQSFSLVEPWVLTWTPHYKPESNSKPDISAIVRLGMIDSHTRSPMNVPVLAIPKNHSLTPIAFLIFQLPTPSTVCAINSWSIYQISIPFLPPSPGYPTNKF